MTDYVSIEQLTVSLRSAEQHLLQAQHEFNTAQQALVDAVTQITTPGVTCTARQREVLSLVRQEMGNKQIAAALNISERTVKFHVSCLLEKANVQSRRDLIKRSVA